MDQFSPPAVAAYDPPIPATPHTAPADAASGRGNPFSQINAIEARVRRNAGYTNRAWAIVDRVLPKRGFDAHPFSDPEGFAASCQHAHRRNLMFWRTFARLQAKAEGGDPCIRMPKDQSALEGSAMQIVSRELEAEYARLPLRRVM